MKKFLSVMLAMLMLALPVMSLADETANLLELQKAVQTTITFADANLLPLVQDEQAAAILNDLINAMGLRFSCQQSAADVMQMDGALMLSGSDALSFDALINTNGIYLASNMLGKDSVGLGYQQLIDMLEAQKSQLVAQGVSEAEFDESIARIQQMQSGAFASSMDVDFDLDDMKMPTFMAVLENLVSKAQVIDATSAPEGCDTPAGGVTITLTGEELAEVGRAFMTDFGATSFGGSYLDAIEATLNASGEEAMSLEDILNQLPAVYPEGITMNLYMNGEGELVAAVVTAKIQAEEEVLDQNTTVLRKTENSKEICSVNTTVASAGDMVNVLVTVTEEDDNVAFDCTVSNAEQVGVKVYGTVVEKNENDAEHMTVDVSVAVPLEGPEFGLRVLVDAIKADDVTGTVQVKVLPLNGDVPYLAVNGKIELVDMLPAVNTEGAVEILTMTEDEINAWGEGLTTNAQMELVKIIQLLPTSVLSLLMSGM